jgi:sulfite exporter TauE/SafE
LIDIYYISKFHFFEILYTLIIELVYGVQNLFHELISNIENLTPTLMISFGLLLGITHAFEPDHIASIGTQLIKSRRQPTKNIIKYIFAKSSLIGIFWGAGHTTTIVIIGMLTSFLAITIQDEFFLGFELIVGIMLVFLGITTLKNKKFFKNKHRHPHKHDDGHMHFDVHDHKTSEHSHEHKSYAIGLIHGLAGSGSIVALTVMYFDNIETSLLFFLLFGFGSIIGMSVIGGLIGLPFAFSTKTKFLNKLFRNIAGTASFVLGLIIFYQVGLIDLLF